MAYYKDERDNSSNGEEFTLHVANLPAELDETGLIQIFNDYGCIKGHFYRPNASWAYITYGTYLEAENAIRDLHEVMPLRLRVSFSRDRGCGSEKVGQASPSFKCTEQPQNRSIKDVALMNKPPVQAIGRGKHMDVLKRMDNSPGFPKYVYSSDKLKSYASDSRISNLYEDPDPYASTNELWTSGQLTITPDGKRHVSCGRGYTLYQIPEFDPETSNRINKSYERRTSGLYEYGQDMLESEVGKCKTCSKITKYTCERCHTFYCSRNCQVSNWPQHKIECEAIPALVTTVQPVPIVQSIKQEQTSTKNMSYIQMPLRRPKKLIDAVTTSNEIPENVPSVDNIPITFNKDNGYKYIRNKNAEPATSYKGKSNGSPDTSKYLHDKGTEQQTKYQKNEETRSPKRNNLGSFEKRAQKGNDVNFSKKGNGNMKSKEADENLFHFVKSEFLSTVTFTDVRIILKEDNDLLWVQKVESEEDLQNMMMDLQNQGDRAEKAQVTIGKMYIAQYENIWHRVVVTALNPIRVFYVDYGNEEIANTDDIRKIDKYKDTPRFAAKISLSEKDRIKYKTLEVNDVISVRNISIDCYKTIVVEVKDNQSKISSSNGLSNAPITPANRSNGEVQSKPPSTDDTMPNVSSKLKNIINCVKVGEQGILEIHAEVKNNTYSATLLPSASQLDYEKLLIDLPTTCKEIIRISRYVPRIGDLVCGERPGGIDDWMRGHILSISPFQISVLDEARVALIKRAVPCPKEFSSISTFGVMCEIIGSKQMKKECNQCSFVVVNNKQNKLEIDISIDGEQNKCKGIVEPWVPPMPDKTELLNAPLESGSEVILTAYRSHMCLFVRSLCTEEMEYYSQIMREVSKYALTAKPLKETPVAGEMVIARYIDKNYYRALVLKVQEENISVVYVDFGNTEVINIKDVKVMSNELKEMRRCTCKISLKGVPNVAMTKKANDYLIGLVGAEVPLTCTFSGDPFKDGVFLKESTTESVNDKIIKLLEPPTPKTAEEDKTCYMVSDIQATDLGNVGQTVEVVVLHVVEEAYRYALSVYNRNIMTHIFEVLPEMLKAYCEASPPYIPRDNEACLALYKGGWYRGGCLDRSATPTSSLIFFIDFGNDEFVDHKDIRLIPKDFITPGALANTCNIVNVAPTDSRGKYPSKVEKRLSELIVPDNTILVTIVSYNEETGCYDVEVPKIRDTLIEEGLVTA